MVIASVFSHLRDAVASSPSSPSPGGGSSDDLPPGLDVAVVHVDYGSRPESGAEAEYVRRYAERLGFRCRIRGMEGGARRGETDRGEYERVSRATRFDLYREMAGEMTKTAIDASDPPPPPSSSSAGGGGDVGEKVPVVLGHHRGDLRENVLSNAHRGSGPLDLSGMTSSSLVDGVRVYRPLLSLEKDAVYDYAHKYGVPYFRDTTPRWSTRGKLRNRLLPLLEEIYGDGSLNNLALLARESDMARGLVFDSVLGPFLSSVRAHPMGVSFDTAPFRGAGRYFWKLALREALHSAGRGMFGDGSLSQFLERACPSTALDGDGGRDRAPREGWLQMRRDYGVYLRADGRVYVFHPESFPWPNRDCDGYGNAGAAVACSGERVRVGPWTVSAEVATTTTTAEGPESTECPGGTTGSRSSSRARALLSRRAVPSWDSLMGGRVTYHIRAPLPPPPIGGVGESLPPPLIFRRDFRRSTRPEAWKSSDLRVQSALPRLGLDDASAAELDAATESGGGGRDAGYGTEWCVVRVSLVRDGAGDGGDGEGTMDSSGEGWAVGNGPPSSAEVGENCDTGRDGVGVAGEISTNSSHGLCGR